MDVTEAGTGLYCVRREGTCLWLAGKDARLPDRDRRHISKLKASGVGFLLTVAAGTVLAFLISLFRPIAESTWRLLEPYLKFRPPAHSAEQVLVVILSLALIALLRELPERIWRSLRLGLIPLRNWTWGLPLAVAFWALFGSQRLFLAFGTIALACLLAAGAKLLRKSPSRNERRAVSVIESDLPVPENGEDLLGRGETVRSLVSVIVLEQPAIIAVTGAYGKGKTSFLNLTIGELRKLEGDDLPVIVRFSPWLAADSNALVLSLLNSIVAEIKHNYVVPGLGHDASQFARTLLSVIPRTEKLKDLFSEPSQEMRIETLADRIAKTPRRVLVVLDDLDRMEAREIETVFKLLRGTIKLSNITFLCSFDKGEVALILKATRPQQDTGRFIEKFFPMQFPLPEVHPSEFKQLLSRKLSEVVTRYGSSPGDTLSKSLEDIWEGGASLYFENLRRIKLFLNRINHSLERIADEVNIEDFIRLELIHDVEPDLYEQIFRSPEHFWNQNYAFETRLRSSEPLNEDKAKQWHAEFYKDKVEALVPAQRQYVFRLLGDLFPQFAAYKAYRRSPRAQTPGPVEAEKEKRIFHPRCFPQYFTMKTPSELFPRKEFDKFLSAVRDLSADQAAAAFGNVFGSLAEEDFKRWHFMHLIENDFASFKLDAQRGLCIGMARNSGRWQSDAFELLIASGSTRETLVGIKGSDGRREFLRSIVRESASDLYTLMLIRRMEYDLDPAMKDGEMFRASGFPLGKDASELLLDVREIKSFAAEHVRARYLGPDAPSVFEQFSGLGSGVNRIEPNLFLFNWQHLGPDAQTDARKYLRDLFARRAQDLNGFLKLMFRVDFIDDYSQLKQLFDYKELSELITRNEGALDQDKVARFRERYSREQVPSGQ